MLTSIGGTPFPLERRRAAPEVRRRLGRESFVWSRLPVRQMTGSATYGRLRYDIHATLAAHRCASARVDSRDPVVDSVLIAGHAGTAAAVRGSAWEEGAGDARAGGRLPVASMVLEAAGEANSGPVRKNQDL